MKGDTTLHRKTHRKNITYIKILEKEFITRYFEIKKIMFQNKKRNILFRNIHLETEILSLLP